jgi:5'-3' exonuclease
MRRTIAARQDSNAVYLIDSSIYIFRAWQLNRPSHDVDGRPVNAVQGFLDFLFNVLQRRRPQLIACAFDQRGEHSIRQSLFPWYKAQRPDYPTELSAQFHQCRELLDLIGITWRSSPLVEADDIIGMWAQSAGTAGQACVIVSADKDLCQYISRRDAIWNYAHDIWHDYRAIENRFGVRPHQIADWLALTGDKADNIPGVAGIGPATAARLLTKWGNIKTLLANLHKVREMKFRGAALAGQRLDECRQQIHQNRQITGLIEDPDVDTDITRMTIKPDFAALGPQLDRLVSPATRNQWLALLQTLGEAKATA